MHHDFGPLWGGGGVLFLNSGFQFPSLCVAYITNLDPLLCLEPFQNLTVVAGGQKNEAWTILNNVVELVLNRFLQVGLHVSFML